MLFEFSPRFHSLYLSPPSGEMEATLTPALVRVAYPSRGISTHVKANLYSGEVEVASTVDDGETYQCSAWQPRRDNPRQVVQKRRFNASSLSPRKKHRRRLAASGKTSPA
jgi:hypothetical protein